MKVVLSRKGFDSSNGGIVSPIFEDGTMISFPIPSDDSDRFSDLHYNGVSYSDILSDLHYKGGKYCHVDPDLDQARRITTVDEGLPHTRTTTKKRSEYAKMRQLKETAVFLTFIGHRLCKFGWTTLSQRHIQRQHNGKTQGEEQCTQAGV